MGDLQSTLEKCGCGFDEADNNYDSQPSETPYTETNQQSATILTPIETEKEWDTESNIEMNKLSDSDEIDPDYEVKMSNSSIHY